MSDTETSKIDRPPRIQPELPVGSVKIPKPPELRDSGRARLIQLSLPLVTIVGYVLVSSLGSSGRSPWLIIPMALSVVASTAFALYSFRSERLRGAALERDYANQLTRLSNDLQRAHEQQRRFYTYNYPDPAAAMRIIRQAAGASSPGGEGRAARLWERRAEDADFGVVRIGVGTLPSAVIYELESLDLPDTPQGRAARKLAEASRFVADAPVLVALRPPPRARGGRRRR